MPSAAKRGTHLWNTLKEYVGLCGPGSVLYVQNTRTEVAMKYLAIDFGEKRTGIAVSDLGGSMVFARLTIHKKSKEAFWSELLGVIEKEEAEALVVGMPKTRDGKETLIIRQIRNFTISLKRRSGLPIYIMEETLSSFDAEMKLRDTKKSRSGLDGAAAGILESFLNLPEDKRTHA